MEILSILGPKISKKWPRRQIFDVWTPGSPMVKNCHFRLCQYVRIWIIFRLRPKKAKSVENWFLSNKSCKTFFEKKNFGVSGIPPKWKREENFEFYKSIENILMVILSPHWGVLGEKWRYSVTRKSKNAKIEIGLNPPPLNTLWEHNMSYKMGLPWTQ